MAPPFWLGLDLGGTNAKGAVVDDNGRVLRYETRALGQKPDAESVVAILAECGSKAVVASGIPWSQICGIGVGTPGAVIEDEFVSGSGNLGWERVPLKRMVADALGFTFKKIILLNDADAAMHAELWVGAASGGSSAALLTLGTGVGCGIAIFGKVVSGATNTMEGGHIIVLQNGRKCPCGSRGCLEAHASARAISMDYQERSGYDRKVSCEQVFTLAQEGDTIAQSVVDAAAQAVALGCLNLIRLLDPQVVILTGGVATEGNGFLDKVKTHAENLKWTCLPSRHDDIVLATAGPHTGCLGAAKAVRDATSIFDPFSDVSRSKESSCCFSLFSSFFSSPLFGHSRKSEFSLSRT